MSVAPGPWELFARIGYISRGIVFVLVGALSMLAAFDGRQRVADGKDALRTLLGAPLGRGLLLIIAVGLLCFAAWRLCQSMLDADRQGVGLDAIVRRAVQFAAALFYVAFAGVAISIALGWGGGGDSDQLARGWTAWLLERPYGRWLIGAVGIGIIGSAGAIAFAGYRAKFTARLELDSDKLSIVRTLGSFGFLARSFVYATIGCFVVFAALHAQPGEAKGFGGALRVIQQQSYGSFLLGFTALGLLAFGVYGIAEGLSRRIDPPGTISSKN